MGVARSQKENTMATIGDFTATDDGFVGFIKTLTLNIKVRFVAVEKDHSRGPDYRLLNGVTQFGAAWKKAAREGDREFLSVKLDDPSFPAPVYAQLIKVEGNSGYNLIWNRRTID
jgi:uncharacterized protein (DUF736 family)